MDASPMRIFLVVGLGLFAVPTFAEDKLPNLVAVDAERLCLDDNGNTLRFDTTSWNAAAGPLAGPLEIRAAKPDRQARTQKVYQRIYNTEGGYRDEFVGRVRWHKAHNHFHFENYAEYILQSTDGDVKDISIKTTFCIIDTTRFTSEKDAVYTSCGTTKQGMSVGWGDTYRRTLSGQSLDVSGLPDGTYRLTIDVDPNDLLKETSNDDNTSVTELRLEALPACP